MRQTVVGANDADRAQLGLGILIPNPQKDGALVENGGSIPRTFARPSSAVISLSALGRSSESSREAPSM